MDNLEYSQDLEALPEKPNFVKTHCHPNFTSVACTIVDSPSSEARQYILSPSSTCKLLYETTKSLLGWLGDFYSYVMFYWDLFFIFFSKHLSTQIFG